MNGEAYRQVQDRVLARSLGPAHIRGHRDVDLYALNGLRVKAASQSLPSGDLRN